MTRNEVLRLLRRHKATLARRFGVIELALYGSFARDRGSDDSDVDILVRFDAPPDWRRYFGAQAYLEDLLGRPVDMARAGSCGWRYVSTSSARRSMSDADQPPREWRFYIVDMIEFAERVLAYTKGVDQDTPRRIDCGGRRASPGSRRSTPPSRPGRTTTTSTTSPTRTAGRSGWRDRSRWRACRRIACWRSTRTTSSSTAPPSRGPTTGRSRTSRA